MIAIGHWLAPDQPPGILQSLLFVHHLQSKRANMSRTISSLMQPIVWSVGMDATVAEVETLLSARHLSWVPVTEPVRGEAVGVISASDIVQFHAQNRDAATSHAWQMCTYKPIVADLDTPIDKVAALMVERGVHHVVVTGRDGMVGIVSSLDFVRTFAAEDRSAQVVTAAPSA
ncbi:CBS domain-containing protein [Variovorax humicola]|uniref:CBS domain-containing protein n=1 Tax=Variovorax humicola TaxID=1769758 RepID=A0ABU8W9L0_9BURK